MVTFISPISWGIKIIIIKKINNTYELEDLLQWSVGTCIKQWQPNTFGWVWFKFWNWGKTQKKTATEVLLPKVLQM